MNAQEQFAIEKVQRWSAKAERAETMLATWKDRLSILQAKGKPSPSAKLLPPLVLVSASEHLMPRSAIKTAGDVAAEEHAAREAALRDMAAEAGDKVAPKKNKTPKAKAKK